MRILGAVPAQSSAVIPLADGSLVASHMRVTADGATALNRVDPSGISRLLFARTPVAGRDCVECLSRVLLKGSSADAIWIAHRTSYRMERWNPDGSPATFLTREVSWFLPRDWSWPVPRPDTPPAQREREQQEALERMNTLFQDAAVDREGRIWVSLLVLRHPRQGGSYIEVLDSRTGELLVATRFSMVMPTFIDGEYAFKSATDSSGFPYVNVMRMRIVEQR